MFKCNYRRLRVCFLSAFVLSLIGCAVTVPMMPDKSDLEGKQFIVKPDNANLYIVRPGSIFNSGILLQIVVDGKIAGAVKSGTYILLELASGLHTVSVTTEESSASLDLNMSNSQNYFVKVKPKWGWLNGRVSVAKIKEEDGKHLVEKTKRAHHTVNL